MPTVEIRWRPSGGRGEFEHVPQEVLIGRQIIIDAVSIPNALLTTDAWGRIRDGKPRIRRANPNNRSILNVPQLVAALAWLPEPRREDQGRVALPLRDKGYVISAIKFAVKQQGSQRAICTPVRIRILHVNGEIDLVERLTRIAEVLKGPLPPSVQPFAAEYKRIVLGGVPSSDLSGVSRKLDEWLESQPMTLRDVEAPSGEFVDEPEEGPSVITVGKMTADETKRRLAFHWKIDRDRGIRKAKIGLFTKANKRVYCENCAFDFERKYGDRGAGFIEVHHISPLATLLPNTVTNLRDLALLCSNCHRIVHRRRPLLDLPALSKITRPWAPPFPSPLAMVAESN